MPRIRPFIEAMQLTPDELKERMEKNAVLQGPRSTVEIRLDDLRAPSPSRGTTS